MAETPSRGAMFARLAVSCVTSALPNLNGAPILELEEVYVLAQSTSFRVRVEKKPH